MENIGKIFWKVLAQKKIAWLSKWYLVQSIINKILSENWITQNVKVIIKHNTLVIKSPNPFISHFLFSKKSFLLSRINSKLEEMNFEKINQIKVVTF